MSFPPGTEMFQFPGFASDAYVFSTGSPCGGVSPFGHPRINDRSHLPAAYRSVPRPSSPLGAKASTERPSHTHHTAPPARRTKPQIPISREPRPCHRASNRTAPQHRDTHNPAGSQPARPSLLTKSDSPVKQHGNTPRASTLVPQAMRVGFSGASIQRLAPQDPFTLEAIGFEPTTPCLQSRRSPAELRPLTGTHPAGQPGPQVTDPRTPA